MITYISGTKNIKVITHNNEASVLECSDDWKSEKSLSQFPISTSEQKFHDAVRKDNLKKGYEILDDIAE
jgi:hypothetical protein